MILKWFCSIWWIQTLRWWMLILITRKWDVEVSPNKHMAKKEWHASISPSDFGANNPHGVGKLPLFHDTKGVSCRKMIRSFCFIYCHVLYLKLLILLVVLEFSRFFFFVSLLTSLFINLFYTFMSVHVFLFQSLWDELAYWFIYRYRNHYKYIFLFLN